MEVDEREDNNNDDWLFHTACSTCFSDRMQCPTQRLVAGCAFNAPSNVDLTRQVLAVVTRNSGTVYGESHPIFRFAFDRISSVRQLVLGSLQNCNIPGDLLKTYFLGRLDDLCKEIIDLCVNKSYFDHYLGVTQHGSADE